MQNTTIEYQNTNESFRIPKHPITTQPYLSFILMLFDRIAGVSRDAAAAADKKTTKKIDELHGERSEISTNSSKRKNNNLYD